MKSLHQYITEALMPFSGFYLSRVSMPQLNDIEKFEEWLVNIMGIHSYLLMVRTSLLEAMQVDYDQEKVDRIISDRPDHGPQHKPIVTDEAYKIVDGHHRYMANIQTDEVETWVLRVELPINQLLKLAYQYKEQYPDG
jgi:hypothetical protein